MHKLLKKGLWIVCLSLITTWSYGQQPPVYSQYMMNGFLFNPATAGSDGYNSINVTAREQWLGLPQSPSTQSVSFQTRLLKTSYISKSTSVRRKMKRPTRSGRVGVGGHFFTDRNGLVRRTGIQLTYAYHIPLDKAQLSFGLTAVGYQFDLNEQGFYDSYDPNDPLLMSYDRVVYIPDANFGVYYRARDYWAGFSVTSLFGSAFKIGVQGENNYTMHRYLYLTGGYNYEINNNLAIQPTVLLKSPDYFRSYQMDISGRLVYQNSYWGGLSYRTPDAMIIFAGLKLDNFYFGYAFDYTLSSIRKYTLGSHEFMFAVKFGESARRYRWLSGY